MLILLCSLVINCRHIPHGFYEEELAGELQSPLFTLCSDYQLVYGGSWKTIIDVQTIPMADFQPRNFLVYSRRLLTQRLHLMSAGVVAG